MTADLAATFLDRLDRVAARLRSLSRLDPPSGLTEPDQPSGERWEWGQVWAHTAEFPRYWIDQVQAVLAAAPPEPPPFGRTKSDPARIEAIERDRAAGAEGLMERLEPDLEDLRTLLLGMTGEDWRRRVRHQTLGVMDMTHVVEDFLVGHLEAHAAQLEGLLTA